MLDRILIKGKLPNLFPSLTVVGSVHGIGEQELRLALGRVFLYGRLRVVRPYILHT